MIILLAMMKMEIEERLEVTEQLFRDGLYLEALQILHRIIEEPSLSDEHLLSHIFYDIGNILMKLGYKNEALSSWKSSLRIFPDHSLQNEILQFVNPYGMVNGEQSVHDDFKAFASVQMARYLALKQQGCFSSLAEADMVMDLISDHWADIIDSGLSNHLSCSQKLGLFHRYHIDFPLLKQVESVEVVFDFQNNRLMESDTICNCGSGLPFYACCGSILDPKEYLIGLK